MVSCLILSEPRTRLKSIDLQSISPEQVPTPETFLYSRYVFIGIPMLVVDARNVADTSGWGPAVDLVESRIAQSA